MYVLEMMSSSPEMVKIFDFQSKRVIENQKVLLIAESSSNTARLVFELCLSYLHPTPVIITSTCPLSM